MMKVKLRRAVRARKRKKPVRERKEFTDVFYPKWNSILVMQI